MSYLLIENKGELDINSLILMGGTDKRENKNKIGFFGTGNKYTIAGLLRKNINFKIFQGEKEIKINTKVEKFRDVKLDRIIIDNKDTSLTVQMGPDWEEWFFIRELYQNSIDEGDSNIVPNCESAIGKEGKTRFYIEQTINIQQVIDNWDQYFSNDRIDKLYSNNNGEIFPNIHSDNRLICYKQGIKCTTDDLTSLYNYNIDTITINESRVAKDEWVLKSNICKLLCSITDVNIIKYILSNIKQEYIEYFVFFYSYYKLTNEWRQAIDNHKIIVSEIAGWYLEEQMKYDCYILPNDLCKKIQEQFPEIEIFGLNKDGKTCAKKEVSLDKRQDFILKECLKFLEEANYRINYPLKVVEFESSDILGLAEDNTIYISIKQFLKGKKEIVATIIEENEHLKTGFSDKTRAFQSHFINLYLSEMEERIGSFL